MTTEASRQLLTRGLMVLVFAGLLTYGVFTVRSFTGPETGSSQRETLRMACLACGAEMVLPASESSELPVDPDTGGAKCPKCGAFRAYAATVRCPKCRRGVPEAPELRSGPFVCPWCKESMNQLPSKP
jgi:hypothetical protein